MSNYYYKRGQIYYYRRRVPEFISEYDTRKDILISLSTKDEKEAIRKTAIYNDYFEEYWRNLLKSKGQMDKKSQWRTAVKLAKRHSFTYKNASEIANSPIEEVVERMTVATKRIDEQGTVSSVLGGVEVPRLLLSNCIDKYWPLCIDKLINKSDHQIRKWKNPRLSAFQFFVQSMNNINDVHKIERSHIIKYKKALRERIEKSEIKPATANKSLGYMHDILYEIGVEYEVKTNFKILFADLKFKETSSSRSPFEEKYVQETFLSGSKLSTLNKEARMLVYAMSDTGARESELIGLRSEDIILNEEIPYIWIQAYKGNQLKTPHSTRKIPLVGAALYAFKELDGGFKHYKNADTVSSTINKFFRENNLKPSENHTLYSLRHTFKDRLRDAGAPEEVIDELMGHKNATPKYGRGHLLEKKYLWLQKIAFPTPLT